VHVHTYLRQKGGNTINKNGAKVCAAVGLMIILLSVVGAFAQNPADIPEEQIVLLKDEVVESFDSESLEILKGYENYSLVRIKADPMNSVELSDSDIDYLPKRTTISVGGMEFDFTKNIPDITSSLQIDRYEEGTYGQYIVHMIGPISSEWVLTLEENDVEILNYVSNHAYRVRMTPETARNVEDHDFVDWVGIYHPAYKLENDLKPGMVEVRILPDTCSDSILQIRNRMNLQSVTETREGSYIITGEVSSERFLDDIANINEVDYVRTYIEPELHDEIATQHIAGGSYFFDDEDNDPETAYRKYGEYGSYMNQLGYTGEGVVTAVADTGLGNGTVGDSGHPDFTGRVIGGYSYSGGWEDGHGHGTHCAGSVGGNTHNGTGETFYKDYYSAVGTAPETEFYAVRIFNSAGSYIGPSNIYHIVQVAKQDADAYIHSNSWGGSAGGAYDSRSASYDRAVRNADPDTDGNQPMVITTSAGNSGSDDYTIGTPATAKNVISVGATERYPNDPEVVTSFSSRGWTSDNRVKPDVVAPGSQINSMTPDGGYQTMSGTSMSNPAVAGAAATVVEWYEVNHGVRPSPAMVKSLLINTANPIEGNTRGSIPNQDEGWGMVDISKLQRPFDDPVQFYLEDQTSVFTDSLQEDEHLFTPGREGEPLKISLVWTDKEAPGDTDAAPSLINDLDLEVESPSGKIYRGNAFENDWTKAGENTISDFDRSGNGRDDTNNVENVYIHPDEVESGLYTVRITAREIAGDAINLGHPSQDYALVAYNALDDIDGEEPTISLLTPDGEESFEVSDEEYINWETEEGDDPIDSMHLSYSSNDGVSWNTIESGLEDTGSYLWTIPNVDSEKCLVRVRAIDESGRVGEDKSQDTFEITGDPPEPVDNLTVEYFGQSIDVLKDDDVEEDDLGYITGESHEAASDWAIRQHGASSGDNSWDFGDGEFNKDPDHGMLSWLITPEISIPSDSDIEHGVYLTFDHWRDFGDNGMYDGGNVKISTEGADGPWTLIVPEEGYDGTIPTAFGNPLGGEEAYGSSSDWTKATFDITEYIGENVHIRWDAGTEAWEGLEGPGWRVDDIYIEALTEDEGTEHNLLTWDCSPDDPEEVDKYNIYRSEDASGPWDESTHIDSVEADNSSCYEYIDSEKGTVDDTDWWYVVRSVGENGLEESNVDAVTVNEELETTEITLTKDENSDGWNFVSLTLIPSDDSLEAILNDPDIGISGSYDRVMYYDASSEKWLSYMPDREEHFNDDFNWDITMGVWVRMISDDVLTVEGRLPSETTITIYSGWNMVSYPSSEPGKGVPDSVSQIGYFDGSKEYNIAYTEDVDTFEFQPGKGYWIYNEEEFEWTVEY